MARKTRRMWWYLIPLALCAALVYRWKNWSNPINGIFSRLLYPLIVKQYEIGRHLGEVAYQRADPTVLQARANRFERECNQLRNQLTQALAMQAYYANIKELLDFKHRYCADKAIICRVLLKHLGCDEHYFLLGCGAEGGIKVNMIAVAHGQLIGRVLQVFPHYSKLMLVTDKRCRVAAYCAKTRTAGIYTGANALTRAGLSFVNHLNPLQVDDLVLSSGEGPVYPEGFGLGTIVDFKQQGVGYEVNVRPLVPIDSIGYCAVVDSHNLTAPSTHQIEQQNDHPALTNTLPESKSVVVQMKKQDVATPISVAVARPEPVVPVKAAVADESEDESDEDGGSDESPDETDTDTD